MNPMVEKVARVLEPQAWAALGVGDTLAYKNRRTSSLRKARAAIAAMSEPTDHMEYEGEIARDVDECGVAGTYRAMISAALSDSERDGEG